VCVSVVSSLLGFLFLRDDGGEMSFND